ncbi:MAG: 3-hydroxybutyryl-CoA dehydrogenase [Chitinophagaceae bacterium]|nr:3-hydroxybutyryl-CoA dehydrogenase [Chitinophagaceae bacterium]
MISTICVCGAGTMGSGIAQAAAQSGFPAILYEVNPVVLEKAELSIGRNLDILVEKGKISAADKQKIMQQIRFTGDIADCMAGICIEAIIEKPEAKIALFGQLAELNGSGSVFASNTSSLSISDIARQVKNPERVIGMHFFNPAPVMKLVEVVTTDQTGKEVIEQVTELARQMGKTPVVCKDSPGFIVNRVARPYYIESLRLAEEELASFEQIDRLMESAGFKMGPFKLMDLIGNDVNYAVSCSVYEQLNKPERLKPSFIQERKVQEGKLGKKTGEGYYNY